MSEGLLAAEFLTAGRGDRVLVADLNLQLARGQLIHLRGPNGAGKTSLLEVLAGLRPPMSGQIVHGAGGFHWLGHKNALNADLSLFENLRFWSVLQGADTAAIVPALERLNLARLRHRPSRSLSAGQKRRAALARLLIAPRRLWLLDEPLAALDSEGLAVFGRMLDEHLNQDGGAIVTSHQPLPLDAARVTALDLRS